MKWYQIGGIFFVIVLVCALSLLIMPEGDRAQTLSALERLWFGFLDLLIKFLKLVRMAILLTVILTLVGFLGRGVRGVINYLDRRWLPRVDVVWWIHALFTLGLSLPLGGVVQTRLVPWIVLAPWAPWVYWLFSLPYGGRLFYEVTSVPWFVYGMIVFWIGYASEGIWEETKYFFMW